MDVKGYKITAYDLGGEEKIRDIWKNYYAEVYGLVYIVDSAGDKSTMDKNKQMLETLGKIQDLKGKPFLIFLNKKDLPEAVDELQFSDDFKLHSLAKEIGAGIRVESICGIQGTGKNIDPGIIDGFEWLIDQILVKYTEIEKGVQVALTKLKERQIQERLERQHRLAALTAAGNVESPERPSTSEMPSTNELPVVEDDSNDDTAGKISNGKLVNVVGDLKDNEYYYDPPSRVQRILEHAKKMKHNKVAPAPNVDSPTEKVTMNELQEKEDGYDNRGFEKEEDAVQSSEVQGDSHEPKISESGESKEPQGSKSPKIEKLQLENRVELPEKTAITDREAGDHNWHEVKSI